MKGDREIGLVDDHAGYLRGELHKVLPRDVLGLLAGRSDIGIAERRPAALMLERLDNEVLDANKRLPSAAMKHHHGPALRAVQVARELRSRHDGNVNFGHRW